jgi:CheY-like chemotaxis protein
LYLELLLLQNHDPDTGSIATQSFQTMLENPTEELNPPPFEVLFVTNKQENCVELSDICSRRPPDAQRPCKVVGCGSPRSALRLLKQTAFPIVFCETEPGGQWWKGLLERLGEMPDPPVAIIASRAADESLWSEALNRGAYDVLALPLEERETSRVLCSAWLHWKNRPREKPQGAGMSDGAGITAIP